MALHLADVNVAAAAASVTNAMIVDMRASALASQFSSGDLKATATSTAPLGWLLCDGSAVLRTGTTAALFAAIGTTYGTGDGSTTFNLPDMRGRVPVGVDGAAGGLAANDALGNSGGEEKHTMTAAELVPHTHTIAKGVAAGDGIALHGATNDGVFTSSNGPGSASPFNVMQPYQVVNWMVKL
jgi:microcystin-dependent protein